MTPLIIISARYDSTRFPGKPLAKILGKPMILHTADNCSKTWGKDAVLVATDDKRISDVVTKCGYNVVMTPKKGFATGTDRAAYAAELADTDFFVYVQGDEPLVSPDDIEKIYNLTKEYPESICGLYAEATEADLYDRNCVKIVFDDGLNPVYYTRSHVQTAVGVDDIARYKQVCVYGFYRKLLLGNFGKGFERSRLEKCEDVEILRVLDKLYLVGTHYKYQSVDTPEDIEKVERILKHGI